MVNLSLALAFVLSFLFSPGGRLLNILIGTPVLQQNLPTYQSLLLLAFVNYWIPTVLIFFILRLFRAECWLRSCKGIRVLLGLSNLLLVLYAIIRIFSTTIEGGGATFVIMSFGPLIVWPALAMIAISFGWLTIRSFQQRGVAPQSNYRAPGLRDFVSLTIALIIPVLGMVSILIYSEPFKLAREADKVFQDCCKEAGEKFISAPNNVQSVYLDQDYFESFYSNNNVKGVYSGHSFGPIGGLFVNNGLKFYEKKNDYQQTGNNIEKYRKYIANDTKGEPVNEVTSDYGVFQKSLMSEGKNNLQLHGTEISVRNMKTGQTIATLKYFVNQRHRTICGPTHGGNFDTSDFVRRALNLKEFVPYDPSKPKKQ